VTNLFVLIEYISNSLERGNAVSTIHVNMTDGFLCTDMTSPSPSGTTSYLDKMLQKSYFSCFYYTLRKEVCNTKLL
jgi:hypothetical protein